MGWAVSCASQLALANGVDVGRKSDVLVSGIHFTFIHRSANYPGEY